MTEKNDEIDLSPYFVVIWRRKLFIFVSTLLCAVAGFAISSSISKTYTAKAMLEVKSLVS